MPTTATMNDALARGISGLRGMAGCPHHARAPQPASSPAAARHQAAPGHAIRWQGPRPGGILANLRCD